MIDFEYCIARAQELAWELWPKPNSLCTEAQMMQIAVLISKDGGQTLLATAKGVYKRRKLETAESFITLLRVL